MPAIFKPITFSLVISSETMSEIKDWKSVSKLLKADIAFAEEKEIREAEEAHGVWKNASRVYSEAENAWENASRIHSEAKEALTNAENACRDAENAYSEVENAYCDAEKACSDAKEACSDAKEAMDEANDECGEASRAWRRAINNIPHVSELKIAHMTALTAWNTAKKSNDATVDDKYTFYKVAYKQYLEAYGTYRKEED